jgi:arabinose-5-phosphate isomerase
LRRTLDQEINLASTPIADVMTTECTRVSPGILAAEALSLMQQRKINALLVVDEHDRPVGALNMHDMLKAGVI